MPTLRLVVVLLVGLWAAPAFAGSGVPLLKYVPDDVDLVAAVNLSKSRGTAMFRKGTELAAAELGETWQKLVDAKFDPSKDLDTMMVAAKTGGATQIIVVLEGRLAGLETELRKQPVSSQQQGLDIWSFKEVSAFVFEKRLILCSPVLLADVLGTVKGKRASVKGSKKASAKDLRAAVAATDLRGDAWLAAPGRMFKDSMPTPGAVSWVSGSLATSKGMAMDLKISTDREETAQDIATWAATQLPTAKQLLGSQGFGSMADSIEVKNTGALVVVGLVMSDGELAKVLSYLSGKAGASGGAKSP